MQKSIPLMDNDDDDNSGEEDGTWFPFRRPVMMMANLL